VLHLTTLLEAAKFTTLTTSTNKQTNTHTHTMSKKTYIAAVEYIQTHTMNAESRIILTKHFIRFFQSQSNTFDPRAFIRALKFSADVEHTMISIFPL
jgi:hypothetical protein